MCRNICVVLETEVCLYIESLFLCTNSQWYHIEIASSFPFIRVSPKYMRKCIKCCLYTVQQTQNNKKKHHQLQILFGFQILLYYPIRNKLLCSELKLFKWMCISRYIPWNYLACNSIDSPFFSIRKLRWFDSNKRAIMHIRCRWSETKRAKAWACLHKG